ncbi:hypothetical protein HAX54_028096 [Datura stramonium]|uniref:Uncharacterized protein n=1 Tax=Datura stramonium TaxID=4076 RepID=A0ABS8V648_DATST|nr:hypothetical protein [Datura stramonium]
MCASISLYGWSDVRCRSTWAYVILRPRMALVVRLQCCDLAPYFDGVTLSVSGSIGVEFPRTKCELHSLGSVSGMAASIPLHTSGGELLCGGFRAICSRGMTGVTEAAINTSTCHGGAQALPQTGASYEHSGILKIPNLPSNVSGVALEALLK